MGFYLWLDRDVAWAQGSYEYRPMGAAVVAASDLFTHRAPCETIFGYSASCDPSILTGALPAEHAASKQGVNPLFGDTPFP